MEGNLHFKINYWASLVVGRKFTVVALFHFAFEDNFQVQAPGLYLERRFRGGFFALQVWGAYIWRGLHLEGLIFGISRNNMIACSLAVLIYNNWSLKWRWLVVENLPSCDERSEPRGSLGRLFDPNFCLFCPTAEPGPRLM